jgi:predicted amidophosphoribosyltransferase
MKSILVALLMSPLAQAELLPNKCWNTRLSKKDKAICERCIEEVGVENKANDPCEKEQKALNECFALNLECNPPYDILLKENYNCRTALVNGCFDKAKGK